MDKKRKIEEDEKCQLNKMGKMDGDSEKLSFGACSCSELKIEPLTPPVQHAEGPFWDSKNQVLYYVDTFQSTAYRFNPAKTDNSRVTHKKIEERNSIGVIIPIRKQENEFAVAADRYLYRLKWDANTNNTGSITEIQMVDKHEPKNQFNDGKADVLGRLWIGTLTREQDLSVSPEGGALYRFDHGKHISKQIANTSISNGIAWSSDNKRFFFCDSQKKTISEYEFDLKSGELGESRVLFDLSEHPKFRGIPDGMTIDDKDNLWVAIFGGHGVIHIDGQTGKLIRYVKLPVEYCTSVCFGGPKNETLFVTTSKLKLSEEDQKKQPHAGSVFTIKGLGVKGAAIHECILD